jgi:hypothetical protein
MLHTVVINVLHCKSGVLVYSIYNVPTAVNCVGVTNTICGHNVMQRATSKPANCIGKPDIREDWSSIWDQFCGTFLPDAAMM